MTAAIRAFSVVYRRWRRVTSPSRRTKDVTASFGYDTNYPFY